MQGSVLFKACNDVQHLERVKVDMSRSLQFLPFVPTTLMKVKGPTQCIACWRGTQAAFPLWMVRGIAHS